MLEAEFYREQIKIYQTLVADLSSRASQTANAPSSESQPSATAEQLLASYMASLHTLQRLTDETSSDQESEGQSSGCSSRP